ncbi:hypothetical protein QR680_017366 [Steinernema hermaphroditum]|uniref:Clc-like protein n=1 Tax=Steinernema hermaphroditum TaxID=289476 RepID=A0AA39LP83_9BILA|nr:hypothetical protein QR680_017366 [Steinernema hermaphroditum]
MLSLGSFSLPLLAVGGAIGLGNALLFLSILTPAWQVAEDLDAHRYVQSGLWLYCPGSAQCWYIFSDDLINYYEKVDICRFFLIGDCRKKLLRTPYFFGWHYAVLILLLSTLGCTTAALVAALLAHFKLFARKAATIVLMTILSFGFILYFIGLAVFMINAEMLESRYLIGISNVFEKSYGYSFFLSCLGCLSILFSLLAAIYDTTTVFFGQKDEVDADETMAAKEFGVLGAHHYNPLNYMPQTFQQQQYPHGSDMYYADSQSGLSFSTMAPAQGDFQQTTRTFFSY